MISIIIYIILINLIILPIIGKTIGFNLLENFFKNNIIIKIVKIIIS